MRYGDLGCRHDNHAGWLVCYFLDTEAQKGTSSLQMLIQYWDLVTMEIQIEIMWLNCLQGTQKPINSCLKETVKYVMVNIFFYSSFLM